MYHEQGHIHYASSDAKSLVQGNHIQAFFPCIWLRCLLQTRIDLSYNNVFRHSEINLSIFLDRNSYLNIGFFLNKSMGCVKIMAFQGEARESHFAHATLAADSS